MGIISGLLGNATESSVAEVREEFAPMLVEGETIVAAYKLVRDMFIFTNARLILVDKQGVTGKKTEYLSIPYSKISMFAKESAGMFDLDAELKIWVSGHPTPIVKGFRKDSNINDVYRLLSEAAIRTS